MYWTIELASYLEDAPWPASRDELIDYVIRLGGVKSREVIVNLQQLDEDNEVYESMDDIWLERPSKDDFFFHEDEH